MLNRDSLSVLMYHAVARAGTALGDADPHYTVSGTQFSGQLGAIRSAGLHATSIARLVAGGARSRAVGLTFDDGHASNRAAADELAANAWTADFFVNPTAVGTAGFLGWDDLRAMAAAGMSIQSHGHRHRYLDELTTAEVWAELVDSKREIEDRIGKAVTVFAPPGGRLADRLADTAGRAGYTALCTSRAGVWRADDGSWGIPRLAVLRSTSSKRFARWVAMDWRELARQRARHVALASAKRILGNQGYERLRRGILPDQAV